MAIDELSGGRLVLGIGVNNPGMLASLEITSRHPRAALRETTDWLRKVFAGNTPPGIRTPCVYRMFRQSGFAAEMDALAPARARGEQQGIAAYQTPRTSCTDR